MKQLFVVIALLLVTASRAASSEGNYHFVVAQDGTGDFRTVQEAVNAVPDFRKAGPTRILIKKGVYKEKLVVANTKDGVQLYGEDGVIITYDDYASKLNAFGENKGTSGSSSAASPAQTAARASSNGWKASWISAAAPAFPFSSSSLT